MAIKVVACCYVVTNPLNPPQFHSNAGFDTVTRVATGHYNVNLTREFDPKTTIVVGSLQGPVVAGALGSIQVDYAFSSGVDVKTLLEQPSPAPSVLADIDFSLIFISINDSSYP